MCFCCNPYWWEHICSVCWATPLCNYHCGRKFAIFGACNINSITVTENGLPGGGGCSNSKGVRVGNQQKTPIFEASQYSKVLPFLRAHFFLANLHEYCFSFLPLRWPTCAFQGWVPPLCADCCQQYYLPSHKNQNGLVVTHLSSRCHC